MYFSGKNLNSTGAVVSLDSPYKIWGGLILGAEVGFLKEVNVIEKYNTLDGFTEIERESKQSNTFMNIKITKYFKGKFFPYVGMGWGVSDSEFIQKPILYSGINLKQFSKYPLNLNFEIRSITLNLQKQIVSFNNFGESEVSQVDFEAIGVGVLASLVYIF